MLFYVLVGIAVILFLLLLTSTNKYIDMSTWKVVIFATALVPLGYFSGKLMRLIEAGTWSGVSYYGAVLFTPFMMCALAVLLKEKPSNVLDLCAPIGGLAVALFKIKCYIDGCCVGRVIYRSELGTLRRFPSRGVEMVDGLIIMIICWMIIRSGKQRGFVYAWFLLLYGVTRFVLDLLRDTEPFFMGLSAGCFWSIIAAVMGGGALLYRRQLAKDKVCTAA